MNFKQIAIVIFLFSLIACAGNTRKNQYVFRSDPKMIREAKSQFYRSNYEILFLVAVDSQGKVVRAKMIDYKEDRLEKMVANSFKRKVYSTLFIPAKGSDPDIREIFYPFDVNTAVDFEALKY